MIKGFSAGAFMIAVTALLVPSSAVFAQKFCEQEFGSTGRLLLFPSGSGKLPRLQVVISEENDQDYEAWWDVGSDLIAGSNAPSELEIAVDWAEGAPPPDNSTVKLILDGKEATSFLKESFSKEPNVVGTTLSVRRQDGEFVPNIWGHRKLTVVVEAPSGKVHSSQSYNLPRWRKVRRQIYDAMRKIFSAAEKNTCYKDILVVEPW